MTGAYGMGDDYRAVLETAIAAAHEAGALLRDEFLRTGGPRGERGHADVWPVDAPRLAEYLVLSGSR